MFVKTDLVIFKNRVRNYPVSISRLHWRYHRYVLVENRFLLGKSMGVYLTFDDSLLTGWFFGSWLEFCVFGSDLQGPSIILVLVWMFIVILLFTDLLLENKLGFRPDKEMLDRYSIRWIYIYVKTIVYKLKFSSKDIPSNVEINLEYYLQITND